MRLAMAVLSVLVLAAPGYAQAGTETADVHVVDRGDTLWDLAGRYLDNPFRWSEIFQANTGTISDPDRIFPDQRLLLPGATLASRDAAAAPADTPASGAPARTVAARTPPQRTVFYQRQAGEAESRTSIRNAGGIAAPSVAAVTASAYYGAPFLVPDTAISAVGTLAELVAPTVIPLRGPPQIQPYDRVFMPLSGNIAPGDRVQLLRRGEAVPSFGRIYLPTGTALVVAVDNGVATVEIDGMYSNVELGDIAVALPRFAERLDVDPQPATGLEGVLLRMAQDQPISAREDVGFVNLGTASGVTEGDEFIIYIPETEAEWGTRPGMDVARVRVIRTNLLTSSVQVIEMEHPAIAAGLPVRLVARMP